MLIRRVAAFTENGAGGNPAGVVLADSLPPASEMQRMAAEVGYSETVFAAPTTEGWMTRYFSPEAEVPFCGHATIALGAVLAAEKGNSRYRLLLQTGEIEVEASVQDGSGHATLRSLPTHSRPADDGVISEALHLFGYTRQDLDQSLPAMLVNAGASHLFFALSSRKHLSDMRYDLKSGRSFMQRHGLVTVMLAYRETARLFHARNAFASGGVLEDPATGAAAAALAGMLRDRKILSPGEMTILQGADMGRPSRIFVRFDGVEGSPVHVSGNTAKIV
jgi:PhzF family phenazine biosynthesis protein